MDKLVIHPEVPGMAMPGVDRVAPLRALHWLRLGWTDLAHSPLSFVYGGVFALMGYALAFYSGQNPPLALSLFTGFLLAAPLLAVVFYDISRAMDLHRHYPIHHHLRRLLRIRGGGIGMYTLLLLFGMAVWTLMSAVLAGFFLRDNIGGLGGFAREAFFSGAYGSFVAAYTLLGLVFGAVVFALSVVTLPMLMDRKVDFATAATTSLWVVRENALPMLVWAVLIAALVALGFATVFFGLVVIFPWLGHATWHAYRDLVER